MKLEFSRQVSEKYSNIKFHENPPNGNRDVPFGTDEQRDIMKSIIAFRNLASAPKVLWYIMDIDSSHCTVLCFVQLIWEGTSLSRAGIAQWLLWLGHGQDNRSTDFEPRQGQETFRFFPKRSDRLRFPSSHLLSECWWLFPRGVNLITHHKVPGWEWLELYLCSPLRPCDLRRAAWHHLSTGRSMLHQCIHTCTLSCVDCWLM